MNKQRNRGKLADRVLSYWALDCNGRRRETPDAYAWPGGYPLYYVDRDGAALCAVCAGHAAGDSDFRRRPCAVDANWEDAEMFCADCSGRIESAYAEDDANPAAPIARGWRYYRGFST